MASYRPYFESQRDRERGYRERDPNPDRRRYGRRYEGSGEDDDRGSYFRNRDPYESQPRDLRRGAPDDDFSHTEGDFGSLSRERRFESFEDWERPRELGGQPSFARPFGAGGYGRRDFRDRNSRFESLGRYSGRGPKNYQRSDERLKEEVCDRLTTDPDIDATEIEVAVENGEVTLEGSVRERQMKRDAEDCIESIPGVHQVHNRIRVEVREDSDEQRPSRSGGFWRGTH